MTASDRRDAMRRIGACALAPVFAIGLPRVALAAEKRKQAPSGDFRLTRRVERSLADGKLLTVARSWLCRFGENGRGLRVDAFAQTCEVDAPPALGALAAMEAGRKEDGPFPALLGPDGRMVGGQALAVGAGAEAVVAALAALVGQGVAQQDLDEARRFMAKLQGAAGAAISAIPTDLFFPVADSREFSRTVPLADDTTGEVTVRLTAKASAIDGLLERIERDVETRIGAEMRVSREHWTLTRI